MLQMSCRIANGSFLREFCARVLTSMIHWSSDRPSWFPFFKRVVSISNLMRNNDINVTSVCVLVSLINGDVQIQWTVPPVFWYFLLTKRILHPVNMESPAHTMMRIAYKSHKLNIDCDCTGLDPFSDVLFKSHHKKFQEMVVWALCVV